ncbi:prepilin-type N-terminal cleavage/methylation domain-containing protein [Neobacillus niacini]|uniref:prepilin-type N-terminal cleavage/methylation domain-containing protein n=1 Tax=Neobacillus niacini TaxID=86668 RepID=UPI00203CDE0A|nr:prepilin-type N-terminal cleavage/methylation domain-containing protein [Neobacillus niacini]MCM3692249.1 prepilin-type N-terminal cleavage/methylation domain-containing protein [Neobacillus niacini]
MFQKLKNKMKDQRGLTLIELLAVIVILAIIAAIAIPSIMGLIDNSKKDAHVANAQQMINSAKIAVTADKSLMPAVGKEVKVNLSYLEEKGYLETVKDPDGTTTSYLKPTAVATGVTADHKDATDSYVIIKNNSNKLEYSVRLYSEEDKGGKDRGVQKATDGQPVPEHELSRNSIIK